MSISDSLAKLNHSRFSDFNDQPEKAAGWAFDGPAHKALDVASLSTSELEYAQESVITLSGLYGFLRVRDALRPYRLEMGTKLETSRGSSLYAFWGDRIAGELAAVLRELPEEERFVVNVASGEYWKAVGQHEKVLGAPVYTIAFPGASVYAKQARGAFCRFMCCENVKTPDGLKRFAEWSTAGGGPGKYKLVDNKDKYTLEFHRTGGNDKPKAKAKAAPKAEPKAKRVKK